MKHQPSPQQQAVLDWTKNGTGSLNLVARAGCGKTSTLMMVVDAIPKSETVVMLAYNKSIAEEIKAKLATMGKPNAVACTVHSVGFQAWRKVCPKVKVDDKKVDQIVAQFALDGPPKNFYTRNIGSICKLVSLAKQSGFGFDIGVTDESAWFQLVDHHAVNDLADGDTTEELVEKSIPVLKRSLSMDRTVIDFDDMILAPLAHNARMDTKDWVLLDEAQDTNSVRRALALKILKPKTGRLIAVGDDRQAIYGFTGADSDAMELIQKALGSTVLPLTVTYRCPKTVVKEANRLVTDLEAHHTAPEGIVRALGVRGENSKPWFLTERPSNTSVILCRNTKPLIEHAYMFLKNGIGCRVEGREIGEGLISLANRWKSVTTLAALSDKLVEYKDREMQKWTAKGREEKAQAVEDKVEALQAIIGSMMEQSKTNVWELATFIRSLFGDTKPGEVARVVTLSTIHKSKGREWDTVYLLDRVGTLPSKYARKEWQFKQEENLEYVAITRSKRELVDLVNN